MMVIGCFWFWLGLVMEFEIVVCYLCVLLGFDGGCVSLCVGSGVDIMIDVCVLLYRLMCLISCLR